MLAFLSTSNSDVINLDSSEMASNGGVESVGDGDGKVENLLKAKNFEKLDKFKKIKKSAKFKKLAKVIANKASKTNFFL